MKKDEFFEVTYSTTSKKRLIIIYVDNVIFYTLNFYCCSITKNNLREKYMCFF